MKRLTPSNWSITLRLTIILLVASLIPMIVTATFNLVGSVNSLRKTEYNNLQLVADSTANRLDQLMSDVHSVVKLVAGDKATVAFLAAPPDERAALQTQTEVALDNVLYSNNDYQYVYLIDVDGTVPISRQVEGAPSIEGLSVDHRDYFQQGMAGESYIDILVGKTSGEMGLYFSTGVENEEGDIIGVAAIKILGTAVWDIVNIEVSETGYAFLIDQDGIIVSHKDPNLLYHSVDELPEEVAKRAGQRFQLPGCKDPDDLSDCTVPNLDIEALGEIVRADAPSQTYYTEVQAGTPRIVGYAPMEHLNLEWVVAVNKSEAEFTAPLRALALQSGLSVVIVGLVVTGLAMVLARGIARPVRELTGAAEAIETDVTHFDPAPLEETAELESDIGRLARVFIRMAQEVKAREEHLKQQVMELRIEIDEVKKEKAVSQIVESDTFQELKAKAQEARQRRAKISKQDTEPSTTTEADSDPFADLQNRAEAMRRRRTDSEDHADTEDTADGEDET